MAKSKYLSDALALLQRVQKDPRMGSVHQERLRKAHCELRALERSGKLDKRRVGRVTKMLCDTLVAALEVDPDHSSRVSSSDGIPVTDNE